MHILSPVCQEDFRWDIQLKKSYRDDSIQGGAEIHKKDFSIDTSIDQMVQDVVEAHGNSIFHWLVDPTNMIMVNNARATGCGRRFFLFWGTQAINEVLKQLVLES